MKRVGGGSANMKDHENSSDPNVLFLVLWSEKQGLIRMGVWGFILIFQPGNIVLHY